jgi:integrase
MTKSEVERQVAAGGDPRSLWESLYLTAEEVGRLLAHVQANARHDWLHPLFVFAAHTGARRSEILRALVADVDLTADVVTVREKKRGRGKRTSRRVPLSPMLRDVLQTWLASHPGGPFLFCHAGTVARSRKRSPTTGHRGQKARPGSAAGRAAGLRKREEPPRGELTRNEVHDHFKRVLQGSEWASVRGLHVLRHTFISMCASKGVDQRLIDEWTGHSTEEQRRRYRHLYPGVQQQAIARVFG